ncbi:gamma-glutamylcyclotransferase [Clostridium tagluense]|uniref:gamma-glutamylcyclotransferase family protein n=1 Tax=Clostridium tagluense TaxID=360422 RepID=UPI001C0DF539|nr:gamma-glutamylcyclotransferase family protein [Clostridium tagluense]MBU3130263.1 gamma-glutamylcyclotransferase [Clostridium tagluense]MCB2310972.1 gamma-glutamylcyclotransferase [Clostridium tagluense]MCB2315826.1 gamma-glutamylcyclotransferase [Clostridium tagluense]MCB2320530.1 gamma-glutamylcyclotransferase [Clostridium tagluense]MCB2325565.1 gamma-glutamylcyclotransferase [Clostridium tagluense]
MVDKLQAPEENIQYEGNNIIRLFVYGTLMKGNSHHDEFLSGARFAGHFIADGFQLYDFGNYPLIIQNEIDKVRGEMYIVDSNILDKIDISEVKGNLFSRKLIRVINDNDEVQEAYVYVYNKDVSKNVKVSPDNPPKEAVKRNDFVWYASYGSNLIYERLISYIKGGKCKFNGVNYEGCRNKSLPKDTRPVTIPYKMYYGNESSPWGSGGISFLDTQSRGQSLGRMYLITEEQFEDISKQEGSDENWYNQSLSLGEYNGVEIVTITNKNTRPSHNPSDNYLEVVRMGIKETYPEMSDFEVMKYLVECGIEKR